ncbi:MAG: TlpA family protein disulfide reductase [Actinomycetota bacterium]
MAFVGVPGNDSADAMQAFVDEFGLGFPQAVTEDGSLWARFGVAYQPAWVFVDNSGETTLVPYELPEAELERVLDDLIAS